MKEFVEVVVVIMKTTTMRCREGGLAVTSWRWYYYCCPGFSKNPKRSTEFICETCIYMYAQVKVTDYKQWAWQPCKFSG